MTKVKLLRFTTDLNVITPAVEHPIQEWLNENKGISVISITSSSRETMDENTPVLAWDVTITYRPKMKLMCKVFYSGNLIRKSEYRLIEKIEEWRKMCRLDTQDIIGIQILDEDNSILTYLEEDTDG